MPIILCIGTVGTFWANPLVPPKLLWLGGPNVYSMPWVKTEVGSDVNEVIERVQEEYDCNKSKATARLLEQAAEEYDE